MFLLLQIIIIVLKFIKKYRYPSQRLTFKGESRLSQSAYYRINHFYIKEKLFRMQIFLFTSSKLFF